MTAETINKPDDFDEMQKRFGIGQVVHFVNEDWHNYACEAVVYGYAVKDGDTHIVLQQKWAAYTITKKPNELYETYEEADAASEELKAAILDKYRAETPDVKSLVRFMYAHTAKDVGFEDEREYEVSDIVIERATEFFNLDGALAHRGRAVDIDTRKPFSSNDDFVSETKGFDMLSDEEQEKLSSDRVDEYRASITDARSLVQFMYGYGVGEEFDCDDEDMEAQKAAILAAKDILGIDLLNDTQETIAQEPDREFADAINALQGESTALKM